MYNLNGTIPSSISNLIDLRTLYLGYNALSGELPESFYTLTSLTTVDFEENGKLTGTISSSIQELTQLITWNLHGNNFYGNLTGVPFPTSIGTLDLSFNLFSGTLPNSLGKLSNCDAFRIGSNQFYGIIPQELLTNSLYETNQIDLSSNFFHGDIENTFNQSDLFSLDLHDNQFIGSLPVLGNYYYEISFYVMKSNFFEGILPKEFETNNFDTFDVSDNHLSGTVALQLSLGSLNLSYNHFSGALEGLFSSKGNPHSYPSLTSLVLKHNYFTGSIPSFWGERFRYISAIDLSENEITGPIVNVTAMKELHFFSASTNCLSGSIPLSFCQDSLYALILNGFSSQENCQMKLFPKSNINSFTLKHSVEGGLPECFWNLPNLIFLHLSGIGLEGTLPNNASFGDYFIDLDLSNNALTGTIPSIFQERPWINLDLSYNLFTGTLSSSFSEYPETSSLTLGSNCLSGMVPSSLLTAENIDILDGNLFACYGDSSLLPENDPNYDTYTCGSDLVNLSIFFWLALLLLFVVILFLYKMNAIKKINFHLNLLFRWFSFFRDSCREELANRDSLQLSQMTSAESLNSLLIFNQRLRQTSVILTMMILLFLLPLYGALSEKFSIYQFSYAWSISALFLNGTTSAIAISIELFCFILFSIWIFIRIWKVFTKPFLDEESESEQISLHELAAYTNVGFWNFVFMFLSDVLYIYIIVTCDTLLIVVAEVGLAILKIFWNNYFLWRLLKISKEILLLLECFKLDDEETETRKISHHDVAFISLSIGLNNLIYPCIAIMVISTSCFYNAFFPAKAISTSYVIDTSIISTPYLIYGDSAYYPAFNYSYECSSVVYSYYCPIFILIPVFESIFIPSVKCLHLLWKESLKRTESGGGTGTSFKLIETTENDDERITSEKLAFLPNQESEFVYDEGSKKEDSRYESDSNRSSLFFKRSFSSSFSFLLSPGTSEKVKQTVQKEPKLILDKNEYTVGFSSYILLLVTFGAVFPPIAVIICVSIILKTLYEEVRVGRLLTKAFQSRKKFLVIEELKKQTSGMITTMKYSLMITFPISTLLYSYLLFDIMGRDVPMTYALIPFFIFLILSCFLLFLVLINFQFSD